MRKWIMAAMPILLGACSAPGLEPADGYYARRNGDTAGRTCSDRDLGRFVGKAGTSALAAEAREAAGASTVRWLSPGQVVTMEFREDRLNIELNEANSVTRLRCG